MAKRYSFPEPACMECRHHQYLGNGLTRSRYCGGFPKRKSPKRFRSSDPQRKAPKWCPRRISPPVCRVYGFADERSQVMDILSRNRFNPKKERYISVASSHYKLLLEKPLGMKAKAFYEAAGTGDVYDILPEDVLEPGIVVEIDDGLKPYYFYFLSWSRVVPVYSFDLARVQKRLLSRGYRKEDTMNSSNYAGRVCPLCGKQYTAPPALSRRDNATSICPECGTMEALDAMEERWCACSGHRSKDFSKLTDYYCRHFIPDGWQLQYSTLAGPEPERLLYLVGKCDQCGGFMRSGVSIACNWTGDRLLLDICKAMLQHRPFDGRDKTGIYRGGCAQRSEWYWKQDQLTRTERIEQFVSLFRESDQPSARLWAEEHMPAPPAQRETTAEFFNAVVELVKSNGFWPEQSAFITCEPARPDAALCHPMFDFRPVLTAEHGGGLRIDCYLNGIFDHAGNSKRLAGTIQTACSDRDTCVLMGSLTGALLHYGGVHREENLDRYVPLHNRDMKKEI